MQELAQGAFGISTDKNLAPSNPSKFNHHKYKWTSFKFCLEFREADNQHNLKDFSLVDTCMEQSEWMSGYYASDCFKKGYEKNCAHLNDFNENQFCIDQMFQSCVDPSTIPDMKAVKHDDKKLAKEVNSERFGFDFDQCKKDQKSLCDKNRPKNKFLKPMNLNTTAIDCMCEHDSTWMCKNYENDCFNNKNNGLEHCITKHGGDLTERQACVDQLYLACSDTYVFPQDCF